MFIYLFILFYLCFMAFMFFLIKTAPYGYEDEHGIHFFKTLGEMDKYIAKIEKEHEEK